MKQCIVKAYTSDDVIEPQAQWAVFEITEELVRQLERYDRAVQSLDPEPFCVDYFYSALDYFGYTSVNDEEFQEQLDALFDLFAEKIESFTIVDELPAPLIRLMEDSQYEDNLPRTECNVARLFGDLAGRVEWRCYIKHTSVVVCTESVKIEELRKAVDENG